MIVIPKRCAATSITTPFWPSSRRVVISLGLRCGKFGFGAFYKKLTFKLENILKANLSCGTVR